MPKFFWRLVIQSTSIQYAPKFQTPRRKVGVQYKLHCLYEQSRHSETSLSVRELFSVPRYQMPAQGLPCKQTLQEIQVSFAFWKFAWHHFAFYKRMIFVPVFANQKKSEEGFHFYQKEAKSKNNIQHLLCCEPVGRQGVPWAVKHPVKLCSWDLHTESQHQAAIALNCVTICASLQFILCFRQQDAS